MISSDCLKGLIAGSLLGWILGNLLAAQQGKETRRGLCESTEELLAAAIEQLGQAQVQMEDPIGRERNGRKGHFHA